MTDKFTKWFIGVIILVFAVLLIFNNFSAGFLPSWLNQGYIELALAIMLMLGFTATLSMWLKG